MAISPDRAPLSALLAQILGGRRPQPLPPSDRPSFRPEQEDRGRGSAAGFGTRGRIGRDDSGFSSAADVEAAKARVRAMAQNNLFTLDPIGMDRFRRDAVLQPLGQIIDIRV